jgi:hypothetical protein
MPTRRPTTAEPPPFTTPPASNTTPERRQQPCSRALQPTTSNSTVPAERVRVTDIPAQGRGRAYLVERELERDGYDALKALVVDYVDQAELLARVPMAVSPLERKPARR